MRILDLDLDFFLDGITSGKSLVKGRAPSNEFNVWTPQDVTDFLERQCGLSTNQKLPGRFVTHHYESFFAWRDWIQQGTLDVPFEIVHVDAHADLGFGMDGWSYLWENILRRNATNRDKPYRSKRTMHEGNYLLFAVACHWVSKLTYVPLDKGNDVLPYSFKNFDIGSGVIQLMRYPKGSLLQIMQNYTKYPPGELIKAFPPQQLESEVPFTTIPHKLYENDEPFDFMVLSHSPPYTPVESDALVPLIRKYFEDT